MNILICPDSFKGSITSSEFCALAKDVLLHKNPDAHIMVKPMADGGENTLECIFPHLWNAEIVWVETVDPLQRPIKASYLIHGDTAYIEMASSSGLTLIEENDRDIMHASTFGTGLVIKHAIEGGKKKIVLFVGGTGTNDGGVGIASALGAQFFDYNGYNLNPIPANMHMIEEIEATLLYSDVEFVLATDVQNPLLGDNGASEVYGPQKGGNHKTIPLLEEALRHYASLLENSFGVTLVNTSGIGAGGGCPLSMLGLFRAKMVSAVDLIFDLIEFEQDFTASDVVITGEGRFDDQSLSGKAVGRIVQKCIASNKKCIIIAGQATLCMISKNVSHYFLTNYQISQDEYIGKIDQLIKKVVNQIHI